MLLTLSTEATPEMPDATDLGFLLHKHPGKAQSFDVTAGRAHVVWPEAAPARSTVALLLEIDPVALVRSKGLRGADGFSLSQYVNDRPYAASSMLAVALGKVLRTALAGHCTARPELAALSLPLRVQIPALPARGGLDLVSRLFAPLGWRVDATLITLEEEIPGWGDSPYVDATLTATLTVADALSQLYVLMPVLDDSKHYWVDTEEIDKLMRAGRAWLGEHPERELITRRYLGHHRELVTGALAQFDSSLSRLAELDDLPGTAEDALTDEPTPKPLAQLRRTAVLSALDAEGAATVVDLGCGEGGLLRALIANPAFTRVVGVDVSHRALEVAARRLRLDRMPDSQRARLELLQSSVTYRDDRLVGFDAVVLMEVIEHLDPPRLPALERTVFGHARPVSVLVTTPNADYNVCYPQLAVGAMRHRDHRFEWSRAEFRAWGEATAVTYGYAARYLPVGDEHPEAGPPTQVAVFRRSP